MFLKNSIHIIGFFCKDVAKTMHIIPRVANTKAQYNKYGA